jgi:phosphopantothenate-cysteine ligase
VERIFYICGKNVPLPESVKTDITVIEDTAELENAVRETLQKHRVEAIIHSMAVSDYRVRTVSTPGLIADAIDRSLGEGLAGKASDSGPAPGSIRPALLGAMDNAPSLGRHAKISSDEQRLVIVLEPTPKIIALFHTLAPQALIVGFKLLDRVPYETLIDTAHRLLEKNSCAFVLANDAMDIHGDTHIGYLVDAERRVQCFEDKPGIARGITETIIKKLREKHPA